MVDMQNPADLFSGACIGKVMNFYRRQSNLSQQAVAGLLSVPCKTYRKYEDGINPIPRSRLSAFLQHLNIPQAEFEAALADINRALPIHLPDDISEETISLVDSFATLDRNARQSVMDMVRVLLDKEVGGSGPKAGEAEKQPPPVHRNEGCLR